MSEGKEMSFWGHIGELRGHLIRSIIAIVVGAVTVSYTHLDVYKRQTFYRVKLFPEIVQNILSSAHRSFGVTHYFI